MKGPNGRSIALLLVGMVAGALVVPPATAHISRSFTHLWGHVKEKADQRYTGETKVVVGERFDVEEGSFGGDSIFCPTGYEAIAGGVEPGNVLDMQVTVSGPAWQGQALWEKRAGTYESAPGWTVYVRKDASTGDSTARMAVVCARR